jgi:hypothetical protein
MIDWRYIATDLYTTLIAEHGATAVCETRSANCCVVGRALARYEEALDSEQEDARIADSAARRAQESGQYDEYAEHPLGGSWEG